VLLGPPGSGKTTVGDELGRLGFRFREWEMVILERWGTRAEFVAHKATALPDLQRDIRTWIEDDGARAVIESTGLSDGRFLDELAHDMTCFVVRFDVSEEEAERRLASRAPGRHLTDDLAGNRRVRREYETQVLLHRPVDLVIDSDQTRASEAAAHIAQAAI
jgi:predicted ATPase